MEAAKAVPGQVVRSIAGRDAGTWYVVVRVLDQRLVAVADGRSRPVARPKRKNVRHLLLTPHVAQEVAQKLAAGAPVEDGEIQQALAAMGDPDQERGSGRDGEG